MEIWTQPVFRWAGSKKKLLPILMRNVPSNYGRYIEPFCGSACLFFALKPKKAILGDFNCELMNAYEQVKRHPRLVHRNASQFRNDSDTYLQVRSVDPESISSLERAARFVYLNRNCFNGVYRTNSKGQFNVPKGTRTGAMPEAQYFYRCSYALRRAQLCPQSYENVIKKVRAKDFVYLDPPYVKENGRDRGEYGANSFSYDEIPTILDCLEEIDGKGAKFLFSYCMDKSISKQLKKKWAVKEIQVQRHVAGFSEHRNKVVEVLASNYDVVV